MSIQDYIWFQTIKVVLPVVWKVLPKDSQYNILRELWAWHSVLMFRKKEYPIQLEMSNLVDKLRKIK